MDSRPKPHPDSQPQIDPNSVLNTPSPTWTYERTPSLDTTLGPNLTKDTTIDPDSGIDADLNPGINTYFNKI